MRDAADICDQKQDAYDAMSRGPEDAPFPWVKYHEGQPAPEWGEYVVWIGDTPTRCGYWRTASFWEGEFHDEAGFGPFIQDADVTHYLKITPPCQ